MNGIGAVQARMAELQTRIDAVSTAPTTGATFGATLGNALAADGAATTTGALAGGQDLTSLLVGGPGSTSALTAPAGTSGPAELGALEAVSPVSSAAAGATAQPGTGAALLEAAKKYLGVPYVWGGEDRSGMDCSGLVQRAFADLGVDVPRVARDQMKIGTAVPSIEQARPGDLIVQRGGAHIGIYVGGNQMLHAPYPGEQVKIGEIYSEPTAIRRVLPTGGPR